MLTNFEDKAMNVGHEAMTDMFHHFFNYIF